MDPGDGPRQGGRIGRIAVLAAAAGLVLVWLVLAITPSPGPPAASGGADIAPIPTRVAPPGGTAPSVPAGVPKPPEPPLAERAQELAGPDGAVCAIRPALRGETARLELDEHDEAHLGIAAVRGEVLVLSDIPQRGSGRLLVEGFAPVRVAWEQARGGLGHCIGDPIELQPAEVGVSGRVESEDGTTVTACGHPISLDRDGGFYASAVSGEPCVVEATRHYGVWQWVERVEVEATPDREPIVEIVGPDFAGVLPLVIEQGRIAEAWVADPGALEGARLLEVDGVPIPEEATADDVHLQTGGEPGTVAEVTVERDGQRARIELSREKLDFDDWLVRY